MQESKSCALPLGNSPLNTIFSYFLIWKFRRIAWNCLTLIFQICKITLSAFCVSNSSLMASNLCVCIRPVRWCANTVWGWVFCFSLLGIVISIEHVFSFVNIIFSNKRSLFYSNCGNKMLWIVSSSCKIPCNDNVPKKIIVLITYIICFLN